MRIVFAVPGLGFGGAERVVSILANQFVKEHQVAIVLTSGDETRAYPMDARIEINVIPQSYSVLKCWSAFRKFCIQYHADAVLAFMDTVGIMASCFLAFSGIPVIISERNDPSEKTRQLNSALQILKKISTHLAAGYVFQSEGAKSFYPLICQKKSCIILNPLDVDHLPHRQENAIERKLVSVGRLHPQKNQKMLIDSFARSKFCEAGYTLHLYGEGTLRYQLENQIKTLQLQDSVFLEGNRKDVLDQIKNASLFVFTSDYEGLPNALLEAMAIGIPSVSTDCSPGGARMLINSDCSNGYIVPCGDTDQLTGILNYLYDNPDTRKTIGVHAERIQEKVEAGVIANQWIHFIRERIAVE